MNSKKIFMIIVWKLVFASFALGAAEENIVYEKLPVKEVTVFKDGHAFVLHEGFITPNVEGDVVLDELPEPVMGTFWAYSPDSDIEIQCVVAGQNEVKYNQSAVNLIELLKINKNKQVLIKEVSQQQPYEAKIVNILSDQVILLQLREGTKALAVSKIGNVTFLDTPEYDQSLTKMKEQMTIKFKNKAGSAVSSKANIGMAYVQKGLRWIPSYRIEIDGNGKAIIKLQGTIVNELVDMENVTAHLVVGVPNFAFKDIIDPISMQQTAAQLSRSMNEYGNNRVSNRTSNLLSNSIMTQSLAYSSYQMDYAPVQVEANANTGPGMIGAANSEDMFVFSLANVSLRKGERMVIPIAEYELGYTDIYTVDIGFQPPLEMSRNFSSQQHLEIAREFFAPKAVHKIRLDNAAKYPLTTAPATILKDGMVMSQSMMKYTPIGGKGDLEITTAVDIKVKTNSEQESTENDAVKWDGEHYSKVKMKGDVVLHNYSDKNVKIYLKRSVLGNMDEVLDSGKLKQLGHSYDGLLFEEGLPFWWNWCSWPWWWYHFNSVGQGSWEVELAPGESKTFNYKWHYFWR